MAIIRSLYRFYYNQVIGYAFSSSPTFATDPGFWKFTPLGVPIRPGELRGGAA
jgi:hypothetical protein